MVGVFSVDVPSRIFLGLGGSPGHLRFSSFDCLLLVLDVLNFRDNFFHFPPVTVFNVPLSHILWTFARIHMLELPTRLNPRLNDVGHMT